MTVKMFISAILIGAIITGSSEAYGSIDDAIDIYHLGKDVVVSVLGAWNLVDNINENGDFRLPVVQKKHKEILRRFDSLARQINSAKDETFDSVTISIEELRKDNQKFIKMESKYREFQQKLSRFEAEEIVMNLNTNHTGLETKTILDSAEWVVGPSGLQTPIEEFSSLVNGDSFTIRYLRDNGLFNLEADFLKVSRNQYLQEIE